MALTRFDQVDRTTLRWLRTSERPFEFTLSSGDAPVAVLRWANLNGSHATAETATGSWSLKRGGFLNPHVTVQAAEGGPEVARLSVHFNYHRLELAAGKAYRFHRAGILVPAWKVTTEESREVLHIEPVREGRRLAAGAVLAPASVVGLPELLLLVVVAWYFIVLAWFEDEALIPLEGPEAPTPPG